METRNLPPRPARTKKVQKNANGEGSVWWSESRARWVAQFTLANGKKPSRFFKLKKDANSWVEEQKRLTALGQTSYTPHPKMKIKEFLESWLEHRNKMSMPPETYRNYEGAIKRINSVIGDLNAPKLSPHAIEEMLAVLDSKYSQNTCLNAYAVLSCAYRYAVKMGDFPSNPVLKVPRPKVSTNPSKHISMDDLHKIYEAASLNPYMHARVEIGAIVGPRPGETLGLFWSDINLEEGYLTVERQLQRVKDEGLVFRPVKQKKSRQIPLTEGTIEILKTHKAYQEMNKSHWEEDLNLVFPNTLGKPLDSKKDRKWWMDLLKQAGVRHYTLYQLRKTAISLITATGTAIPTVLQYTGHTNSTTVLQHYAFSIDENMELAIKKLDSFRPKTGISES